MSINKQPSSSTNALELEVEDANPSGPTKSSRELLSATSGTVVIGILMTEAMQSFAFYGSQVILVLYLKQSLGFSEATSVALFLFISCLAEITPILGALLADGWLGRYKVILCFGSIAALGLLITTVGAMMKSPSTAIENHISSPAGGKSNLHVWRQILSFVGLILLFVGIGGLDPCLSSFGADQVAGSNASDQETLEEDCESQTTKSTSTDEERESRVRSYFTYLYFCTNVGAVACCGFIPLVREVDGFGMAFLVCACCMPTGLTLFFSKRRQYVYSSSNKDPSSLASTFDLFGRIITQRMVQASRNWMCFCGLINRRQWYETATTCPHLLSSLDADEGACGKCFFTKKVGDKFGHCYGACETDGVEPHLVRDAEQALRVVPIMAMLPVFWMLYDQQESVWILQASRMNLHGLQPEQLSLINPILIVTFIPLFDRYIYPVLARCGVKLDPLDRMGIGMVLAATSFFASAALELAIERAEAQGTAPPSVFWQLIQITIISASEIFVAVTGLEFSYSAAPPQLKAFLMAVYSLTKAVGDLFGGVLYSTLFQGWNRATVMFVCAFLMLANRVVFENVANEWYRPKANQQSKANENVTKKEPSVVAECHPNENSSLLPH